MKQMNKSRIYIACTTFICLIFFNLSVFAQDVQVAVKGEDVGNWFSRNWVWITVGAIILLILLLFAGSNSRNRRTTVVTDNNGTIRRTTTEVEEA